MRPSRHPAVTALVAVLNGGVLGLAVVILAIQIRTLPNPKLNGDCLMVNSQFAANKVTTPSAPKKRGAATPPL
jgi:hypothetical protein